jgi:hypothetical protein
LIFSAFLTLYLKQYLKFYKNSLEGTLDNDPNGTKIIIPFLMLLSLSVSPFFIMYFLKNSQASLNNPDVRQKYGALY